ncbi:hypothetical protein BGZ60DRAFT_414873 [Tricladium varicosporioides]|nr:hypothetical protein BGZ60DRAFT_414873 [Hymenoscyphus varicosporioides]
MSFCDYNGIFSDFYGPESSLGTNPEIEYIDWLGAEAKGKIQIASAKCLIESLEPDLRIIFAPLDLRGKDEDIFKPLFKHYKVPPDFVEERMYDVTQGCGNQKYDDGSRASWIHYLCPRIDINKVTVTDQNGDFPSIIDSHPDHQHPLHELTGTSWAWNRAGFFLRWGTPRNNKTSPVTLICFSGPQYLRCRLKDLANEPSWHWQKVLTRPYDLFVIVLDELFGEMNAQVQNVSEVFRGIEIKAMFRAKETAERSGEGEEYADPDFVGLHNVAKHCIFLKEAFNAIAITTHEVEGQHERLFKSDEDIETTRAMLRHKRSLFKSVNVRLDSLTKRTDNTINLSFNLVSAQQNKLMMNDSQIMVQDTQTMKAIAIVTMIFLPATTIATICGTQFLNLDTSTVPYQMHVAPHFAIFWAVSVIVTAIVGWMWWLLNEKGVKLQKTVLTVKSKHAKQWIKRKSVGHVMTNGQPKAGQPTAAATTGAVIELRTL